LRSHGAVAGTAVVAVRSSLRRPGFRPGRCGHLRCRSAAGGTTEPASHGSDDGGDALDGGAEQQLVEDHAKAQRDSAPDEGQRLLGDRPKVRYAWQVPQALGPEVVLVGRSNAGKSTLLNTMLQLRGASQVAPVSNLGGRTRTLNWYPLGFHGPVGWRRDGAALADPLAEPSNAGFCLVDCFGLGPVDYSLKSRRLQSWGPLLHNYMSQRRCLCTVFHLVSSEYEGKLTEGDDQLLSIFQRSMRTRTAQGLEPFEYVSVLTKVDIHAEEDVPRIVDVLRADLASKENPPDGVVACSSMAAGGVGISAFAEAVDAAAARGWALRNSWESEAQQRKARPRPKNRGYKERQAVWESFKKGRQRAGGKPARGGAGAVTELPPAV